MNMDNESEILYPEYPVFKGLQRPLEFMGLQGRYITWAAISVGIAILCFILMYCLFGFLWGAVSLLATLLFGVSNIYMKQMKGLHTKKESKGIYIFSYSKRA